MPNILEDLEIDEVSSVDKGAGDGCRIVFMKRHGDTVSDVIRKAGAAMVLSAASILDDTAVADKGAMMRKSLDQFVECIADAIEGVAPILKRQRPIQADPAEDDDESEPDDNQDDEPTEKSMSTTIVTVAKGVITDGADAYPNFTKNDFEKEWIARAKEIRKSGESMDQAISRFLHTPIGGLLSKAYRMAKRAPAPLQKVAPVDIAKSDAVKSLETKAVELQKREPNLSKDQAFAKVYGDPSNRDLVMADRQWQRSRIGA